jgi:cyclophilin family peptidyl-prolyl cis-trans isomerase
MLTACLVCLALLGLYAFATSTEAQAQDKPQVVLETSKGNITIELDPVKAPKTTENFLKYVESGHYNGTIFHRVIPGFMIQGGGMEPNMREKKTNPPIPNEASNGLSNARGTISMARTNDPNSATAQFFINVADNARGLDPRPGSAGYAVFGKVVDDASMKVVDEIVGVKTTSRGPHDDVPVEPVVITSAKVKGK